MLSSLDSPGATGDAPKFGAARGRPILQLTGYLLLYKFVFFVLIWAMAHWVPTLFALDSFEQHSRNASDLAAPIAAPAPGLWRYFETWDAYHYLHLARHGYGDQPMSLAFYPLWPFLVRLAAPLCGGNFTLAALILSNAFSVAALVLLHRLIARRFNENVAGKTLILMIAFPGALFLCLPYTESLFLLACVALFCLLERAKIHANAIVSANARAIADAKARAFTGDWRIEASVALCAAGAALARPTGLFLIVPLAWFAATQRENARWRWVALAPIVGFAGYFATIYFATGNALAGIEAQQLFLSKPSIWKLFDVPGFVRGFLDVGPARGASGFLHDRVWFILFCATLWPLWKRDQTWFWFAVTMGLATAFSASMMSFTRYVSIIFPCFIMAAIWFCKLRNNLSFLLVLTIFIFMQIYFLLMHINYYWVS